ncbi:MAG: aminodeoxychorismate/anthranilate synthase component II [Desulfitobacteriaceae bacterium]|nr:aminodeoxychorismate/anthranilate synthase component II [Desulfitobacteriaceae bacterium]MDI6880537.1 aminodeoxychorismate/anthranilate synthase component II [Desulfitobacteriaceae bacterium]MDI6914759.1 aminodeoxychorismate/anthranilate synthase component II [Desulfitobacteriaceae bacterium]
MLTVIDNYDSFTYNLVQEFGRLGSAVRVWRNDEKTVEEILAEEPEAVILSPGPCTPAEAGISVELLQALEVRAASGDAIPVLGVCLGHQALATAFGGQVVRAPQVVHGKASPIYHDGTGLFSGLEQGFTAGRYHSLIVREKSLSSEWLITARTEEGLIMGMEHRDYPFYGVQFHPESILTPKGEKIIQAFLVIVEANKKRAKN